MKSSTEGAAATALVTLADENVSREGSHCNIYSTQPKKPVSLWMEAFGGYAHATPKHQTPSFGAGSGGVVVASDYSGIYPHPIGTGVAYAHTHLHENEGAGHADIDQGDVFVYAALYRHQFLQHEIALK